MTGPHDTGDVPPLEEALARLAALQEQAEGLARRVPSPADDSGSPVRPADEIATAGAALARRREEAERERSDRDAVIQRLEERVEALSAELERSSLRIAALEERLGDDPGAPADSQVPATPVDASAAQGVEASLDELVERIERLKRTMRSTD